MRTFGIASSRFRIFHRPIIAKVETVVSITKAVVALHNFLMSKESTARSAYCPPGFIDHETGLSLQSGTWRHENLPNEELISILILDSINYAKSAKDVRDIYKDYFSSTAGAVPWLYEIGTLVGKRSFSVNLNTRTTTNILRIIVEKDKSVSTVN